MSLLERTFPLNPMLPSSPAARADADELLRLERQLFGAWCDFVFRSSAVGRARAAFLASLARVESALGQSQAAGSAWLLGGEAPSIVDLQYVSHVERMVASILYWKGLDLRNNADFPNLEAWLRAFEARPAYLASKSDYYTHCWDIPPQYGDGIEDDTAEARAAHAAIDGGAWRLPLPEADQLSFEPLPAAQQAGGQAAARQEAAFMLCRNAEAVARFAARGAGQAGRKRYGAPLADPTATPLEAAVEPTSAALRCVAEALLGDGAAAPAAQLRAAAGAPAPQVSRSLAYLRLRVGVPRDMSQPAAMQLRAQLTAAVESLAGA
jgi:glutathione S-transferase